MPSRHQKALTHLTSAPLACASREATPTAHLADKETEAQSGDTPRPGVLQVGAGVRV